LDIKIGDTIDAFDKAKVWYGSTVLDIKETTVGDRTFKNLEIGFRIYNENG
jgi:hypothetical protein